MATYNVESWLRHKGRYYKKGEEIDAQVLTKEQQAQLVQKGVISRKVDYADLVVTDNEEKNIVKDEGNTDDGNTSADPDTDEPIEKTLDLNFTLKELKADSKELGLTFDSSVTKPVLIKLIVDNDKQDHFLDQLEDGDPDVENI